MLIAPLFLYVIIVIEGYIVLSSELLAIRQTVPFVGSGTDTVSIIIAAVLMPLAIGYYAGGHYKPGISKDTGKRKRQSPRKKLVWNLCIASVFLLLGLSTYTVNIFFPLLRELGITNRLGMITIYAVSFIVTPVYLLGQTVPLISNYFSRQKLSQITGKMLFFSTVGSFFGSIISTLILMSFFGVHYTVTFNFILIAIVVIIACNRKRDSNKIAFIATIAIISILINSDKAMNVVHIISDNQYNTIEVIKTKDGTTHFVQNNSDSSAIGPDHYKHAYIQMLEKELIAPLKQSATPKNILVIGTGGFTFGLEDLKDNYTYVDIDPSLEKVATEHFLKQKLTANKKFFPEAAQSFVNFSKDRFDLILLDVFNGDTTLPEDLVTVEFLNSLKNKLNPRGIIAINFILSPTFRDPMSRHLDNTLRTVFPYVSRQVAKDFNAWQQNPNVRTNVLYMYNDNPDYETRDNVIYTRDKNRIFFDKPQKRE